MATQKVSDFLPSLGPLGLTLRMRRLTDRLAEGGRRLYAARGLPLQPHGYAVLLLLERRGPSSVTALAAALGLSHPSVIQLAKKLTDSGLLTSSSDPTDGRRRLLSLSAEALDLLPTFEPIWAAFSAELASMLEDAGGDLLSTLGVLERLLDQKSLERRVEARLTTVPRSSRRPADLSEFEIHPAARRDRAEVLHLARELVRAADTYAYDADISDEALWNYWAPPAPDRGHVVLHDGRVGGAFVLRRNHRGGASHIANASYVVRADLRGMGLGRFMGEASLDIARELGFRAMQFNLVVSTNHKALRLWRSLGFRVVGTVPDGFTLPSGEAVPYHIMHRRL